MKEKLKVVSTCYNQENYIEQTLQGFVMQITNFPFEVLIVDDCSTDKTQEIITKYANEYPDLIKPIFREKNVGSLENFIDSLSMVKSEYVAICEGDDYWTDPLKLQRQTDFLDLNLDFSICFHPVRIFYEDGSESDKIYPGANMIGDRKVLQLEHLLVFNFMQTNSVMYRWRFSGEESLKDIFPKDIMPGDYFLHMLHAQKGKIGMLDGVMADYRRHKGGLWWGSTTDPVPLHLKYGVQELKFYVEVEKRFPEWFVVRGHNHTLDAARTIFDIYLKHQRFAEIKQLLEMFPELIVKSIPS
ncbi:MAG: glycosyltransferase [Candidatus Gastranaerophilales bacterium]|nr:glycosyltransferase [Candidatus Gastranaerophilales bacterium]